MKSSEMSTALIHAEIVHLVRQVALVSHGEARLGDGGGDKGVRFVLLTRLVHHIDLEALTIFALQVLLRA